MSEPGATTSVAATGRVIRVFISSTFRDMMRERDLLVAGAIRQPASAVAR